MRKGRHFPVKIVFTGPECSGKTTMSQKLATFLDWPLVGEFARWYDWPTSDYTEQDVYNIFLGQLETEAIALKSAHTGAVMDTDVLTILVWMEYVFGQVPQIVRDVWMASKAQYLLCRSDIPYILDPLRENPGSRDELFDIYLHHLLMAEKTFSIIEGSFEERWNETLQFVDINPS